MATSQFFEPKPALAAAAKVGLYAGGVGLFVSTVQNALSTHNRGAIGVFTRTGGTITFFALMGATYALTDAFLANARHREDALNAAAGGCVAGLVAGAKRHSIPFGLASCAALGGLLGTFKATGGTLAGSYQPRSSQSVEERRRAFFKQPLP